MRYFTTFIITLAAWVAMQPVAMADDAPAKTFIPLAGANKNIRTTNGTQSAVPHFFPLGGKAIPVMHNTTAAARDIATHNNDDIPVAREGKPETMTPDQATQIISLFGSNE
jgi:hypothetical protein